MWIFLFLQPHSLQNKRSILSDQLQIFQAIPNAVVEHIRRNIICQFFDLRRSISHGNLCCSVFKHGKIIVAVSKNNGILPRNIKPRSFSAYGKYTSCTLPESGTVWMHTSHPRSFRNRFLQNQTWMKNIRFLR